jgi:transcriptional regulator with XRE-family HTH domain
MPESESSVGQRIQRYRQQKGISLNQLSKTTGVSKGYLWALEQDSSTDKRPSGETLYAIAETLGVTMSELLGKRLLTEPPDDVPDELREFAKEDGLAEREVRMLAAIQFRGERPRTKRRWRHIYESIQTSERLDEPG